MLGPPINHYQSLDEINKHWNW